MRDGFNDKISAALEKAANPSYFLIGVRRTGYNAMAATGNCTCSGWRRLGILVASVADGSAHRLLGLRKRRARLPYRVVPVSEFRRMAKLPSRAPGGYRSPTFSR